MKTSSTNELDNQPQGQSSQDLTSVQNSDLQPTCFSPHFGLLSAEEESKLLNESSESNMEDNDEAAKENGEEQLAGNPTGNLNDVEASSRALLAGMNEAKKPKKVVSDYYKKQNELLENYKNDSEQIQVFVKTRTRQRLQSSTSEEPLDLEERNNTNSSKAPLLKNVPGEDDLEVIESQPSVHNLSVAQKSSVVSRSHDSLIARHSAQQEKAADHFKAADRLAKITLLVNVSLMFAKALASYLSGSLSIISSLVDSCVDITSGLVISMSTRMIRKRDPYLYPRGRTRLEPLALMIISVVMGVASCQLIYDAIQRIVRAYHFQSKGEGETPTLEMSLETCAIMVFTIIVKCILFLVCQKYKSDPSIEVLAMDHRNDCLSNSIALLCAFLAKRYWYYLDPIGAIVVSCYILLTWVKTGKEHLSKLSGKSAEPEFINRIIKVCIDHDPRISHLDTVYVYHYGTKFLVEVHIVLDENMTLKVAHDISEALQINIESLPDVERAFVHTDYEYDHQPGDEHKVV
ncbi:unnamed protein product [Auanema sp. JU1783]|nr:unnamed protein product [Auanema sp. JU1783]